MNALNISEANTIFACRSKIRIKVHSVPSPSFQMYSRNVGIFLKNLGEDGGDEFWSPIVRELKRFRFEISAAPLSQKRIFIKLELLHRLLISNVNQSKLVYSWEQSELLYQLAILTKHMMDIPEQSLLDWFVQSININRESEIAIAICETRLIPEVEEAITDLSATQNIRVITPNSLREAKCYSKLFVFGAPRWFPEYVFSSPRAKEIHIIKHKWISGKWEPELVLVSTYKSKGSKNKRLLIEDDPSELGELILEDFLPRIDIKRIQDRATEELINLIDDDNEVVVARLFLLENDWAVFLEADDNSSVDSIDLEEEATKRVRRIPVGEIQTGVYILLRTEGGGDYIVPIADKFLGDFRDKARSDQKRWKTLLKEQVKRKGERRVLDELRELGSPRATSGNLSHWISLRGIKTENFEDFHAIMKLVGLENEAEKLWEIMKEIRKAHSKAGHKIRRLLLDQVNNADLDKLQRYGVMEFELSEQGAGSLSAFRIKEIAEETTEVIHWRIGEPFKIDHG